MLALPLCFVVRPALGQNRDLVIQFAPEAAPEAMAQLRAAVRVERTRRIPTLGSEIWEVPDDESAETLARAMQIPGVTAADYAGQDYRSLFLSMPAQAALAPGQERVLEGIRSDQSMTDVRLVRLRQGDLSSRMLLNGFGQIDGLPQDSVTMLLRPGLSAVLTRRQLAVQDGDSFQWDGDLTVAGAAQSTGIASFSVEGDDVLGFVSAGGEEYSIRPLGGGVHAIGRIDRTAFPPDHPPEADIPSDESEDSIPFSMLESQNTGHPVISIAVAYTPAAASGIRIRYGVEPARFIAHAIDMTNRSFAFSRVGARIVLVGINEATTAESGDFVRDVAAMVDPADGRFDDLPPWRRTLRANAVITLVGSGSACGRASQVYPAARATYAMVNYACAIENKSFAHELGHLLGMRHDPDSDAKDHPFAYGHGYRHPNAFRTIMAEGPELRLWAWANPDVPMNGIPMGTATRHNDARAITEMAPIFSGYFGD